MPCSGRRLESRCRWPEVDRGGEGADDRYLGDEDGLEVFWGWRHRDLDGEGSGKDVGEGDGGSHGGGDWEGNSEGEALDIGAE